MVAQNSRPASPVDYAEQLIGVLPAERRPYILARLALSKSIPSLPGHGEACQIALQELHRSNEERELQPPLKEKLAKEIDYMVNEINHGKPADNMATAMLLSWAVDNGEWRG